jgi:hypothetical protein
LRTVVKLYPKAPLHASQLAAHTMVDQHIGLEETDDGI